MKTGIKAGAIIMVVFTALSVLQSCQKDGDINPSNTARVLQENTWKITLFSVDADNQTNDFRDYIFTFNSSGTVSVTKPGQSITGTWSTSEDKNGTKLKLSFGDGDPFDSMNQNWYVLQQSSSTIRLRYINNGNGQTFLLTFDKV